jgi:hypothetical protein
MCVYGRFICKKYCYGCLWIVACVIALCFKMWRLYYFNQVYAKMICIVVSVAKFDAPFFTSIVGWLVTIPDLSYRTTGSIVLVLSRMARR